MDRLVRLIERIDPTTNTVVARVEIPGRSVSAIAADSSAVWALTIGEISEDGARGDGRLVRIDPATNEVTAEIPLGDQLTGYEDQVRLGAGAVWVIGARWVETEDTEYGSDLIRVDPATNQVVARVPVGGFGMAVGADEVWVRFPADGAFDESGERWLWTRVDARTNEASPPFALDAGGLAAITPEALWSVDYDEQEHVRVTRFDPATLEVESRSEAIRWYFHDAVLDPGSGTVWI